MSEVLTESIRNAEQAWRKNASRLAEWAFKKLVNREDVFGSYIPLEQRTAGKTARTQHCKITLEIFRKHFLVKVDSNREGLIGVHSTSKDNRCRWMVIDIDNHKNISEMAKNNKKAAIDLYTKLQQMGLHPLLTSSGSSGGFHLWLIFTSPVESRLVYEFGNNLVSNWKDMGLDSKPEIFPKQEEIQPGKCGNFVRLPGIHHTNPFYSRVYTGKEWLQGREAIDYLIANKLNDFPRNQVSARKPKTNQSFEARFEKMLLSVKGTSIGSKLPPENQRIVAKFLAKLSGVTQTSAGWQACCPAHADRNPSLSVGFGQKVLLVTKCFSGPDCTFEKICDATGMEAKDLTSRPSTHEEMTDLPDRPEMVLTEADNQFQVNSEKYRCPLKSTHLSNLAKRLGVSIEALRSIGTGWNPELECWTFPEHNGKGQVCGIMKRYKNDSKKTVKGSKRGLTLSNGWDKGLGVLHICEGASDTAALLSRGLKAIGIPSRNYKADDLVILLGKVKNLSLAVVPDNDPADPDHESAGKLALTLKEHLKCPVKLITFNRNCKDLREYHKSNPSN